MWHFETRLVHHLAAGGQGIGDRDADRSGDVVVTGAGKADRVILRRA